MYRTIAVIAATLSLSACVETTEATTQEVTFMTRSELLATLPGATIGGLSSSVADTEWTQTYSKGGESGTISGVFGGEPYESTWFLQDNMWCEDWGSDSGCWNIVRESENALRTYKDGTERNVNPWIIS